MRPIIVGFAVETSGGDALIAYARRKLEEKRVDLVVANEAREAFGREDNRVALVTSAPKPNGSRRPRKARWPGSFWTGFAGYCNGRVVKALGRPAQASYSNSVRWIFASVGAAAIAGLGACALISGLDDYKSGAVDASLSDVRAVVAPDAGKPETVDGAAVAEGSTAGDDADSAPVVAAEASCEQTVSDPQNCGACGAVCNTANSVGATCAASACSYTGCGSDWLDCDKAAPNTNGCESSKTSTASCGACGNACDTDHSLGATCVNTDGGTIACQYTGCQPGWADCDSSGTDTDGCETSLTTAANCGACGKACDTKNSQAASCDDGTTCSYTGCNSGYADCNTTEPDTDGCETKVASATCNACGTSCDTTTPQQRRELPDGKQRPQTCKYTTCATNYANCNTTPPDTNGCETLTTTVTNCGTCGKACDTKTSTGTSCNAGNCQYTGCANGYADCNTTAPNTNGCEASLSSTATCRRLQQRMQHEDRCRELHRIDVHIPVQLWPDRLQCEQGA